MFRSDLTQQPLLFAFTVRDLVPQDSGVWLYTDLFDHLDLTEFDADYVSQGKEGIEPRLMLRSIFYGLTHGVVSGRKLEDVCCHDARYIVLSGEQRPSSRTFQRFLVRHPERIDDLFVQIVRLASKMGLVKLGSIAIDGSRFKANSSKHKAMSYSRMQSAITQIRGELAKLKADLAQVNASSETGTAASLPKEIQLREKRLKKIQAAKEALEKEFGDAPVPDKAQKSFADHDAMPMAKTNDAFIYGYNGQAVVDSTSQIIVAADLHDSPNDFQALPGMLKQAQENCDGVVAEAVLADAGYRSGENLEAITAQGSVPYVAPGKGEDPVREDARECLRVEADEKGEFHVFCPVGRELSIKGKHPDGSLGVRLPKRACKSCPERDSCPLQKMKQKSMHLPKPQFFAATIGNHTRMRSAEGKAVYRRRKVIVEPVFGNIKNKGIKILVRGKTKVKVWWRMACSAHNIEKIVRAMSPVHCP